MNAEPSGPACDVVGFVLRYVVADIVHEPSARGGLVIEHGAERLPRVVRHELAAGEGVVRRGVHRPPIKLPLMRTDGPAAQLLFWQGDALTPRRREHCVQAGVLPLGGQAAWIRGG